MRYLLLVFDAQEDTATVEKAVRLVKVRGAHRHIPCIDVITQGQRLVSWICDPGVLVELGKAEFLAA